MSKKDLYLEMANALKAASSYSLEIDAFLLESKNSGEQTRELGNKICAAEKAWMCEMFKYKHAFKQYYAVQPPLI